MAAQPAGSTAALFPPDPALNQLLEPLADVLSRAPADWAPLVQAWQASADGQRLLQFVAQRQADGARIYPAAVLQALREGAPLPFAHDPAYTSPLATGR